MQIKDKIAIVTGAASGIGLAISKRLANCDARLIAMVDRDDKCKTCAAQLNTEIGREVAMAFCGDVCDIEFRNSVFDALCAEDAPVQICIPAAGILRDRSAVKLNPDNMQVEIYDEQVFNKVLAINLVQPIYWALQTLKYIVQWRVTKHKLTWAPAEPIQGSIIFIGSVAARGNRGQISYATAKSGLVAAAKTLNIEGMMHGVQSKIIHPGMVNTPMLERLPVGYFNDHFKPQIPLGRLIEPDEIAAAIQLLIENPAVSGPLWVDGGLPPLA